jgi:hypothetical protein
MIEVDLLNNNSNKGTPSGFVLWVNRFENDDNFLSLSRGESISIYKQIFSIILLPPSDKPLQNPELEFPFRPIFRDLRAITYDN